jgi:hypothetical protein
LKALFPRDPKLEPPEAAGQTWHGSGFGVRPVPNRPEIAVIQQRAESGAENLIWLSGSDVVPTGRAVEFQRPMVNVLDELACWLDDPGRWRGIGGIDGLKEEVERFRNVLRRFEKPTRLELGEAGSLIFERLRVDLLRAWVTPQAIWADVVLRGDATLDVALDI